MNNGILGCTGKRWKDETLPVCAHRTLPCHSWVLVENIKTGAAAWCKIMDRGPYGKLDKNGNWFNAATDRKQAKKEGRKSRQGRYRSILDMGPTVSGLLKSTGMLKVKVTYWKKNKYADYLDNVLYK